EVDGPADLLVEQDHPRRPGDARVRADPELAEEPGAGVGLERLEQVGLAALGTGVDDLARLEAQLDAGDVDPRRAGRDGEAHGARGRVLVRAGEDLARREVAPAVGVDPGAALD